MFFSKNSLLSSRIFHQRDALWIIRPLASFRKHTLAGVIVFRQEHILRCATRAKISESLSYLGYLIFNV